MKIAVMQPYLFPYLGYFQLIRAVDVFVVYDDVAFIQQGWINRNRLKINGEARYFTVPLSDASSFRSIRDTQVAGAAYASFRRKFLATVDNVYRKAPFFAQTQGLLDQVLTPTCGSIADLARNSIASVCAYLAMTTHLVPSSSAYGNNHLKRTERLVDLCRRENADTYINSIGGEELYSKSDFALAGIELQFLRSRLIEYPQVDGRPFVANLSIIDVLMNNSPETVREMLSHYELV